MRTVGIVTFFRSYNYGVWLQAFATQYFFEREGFDAQIINYSNKRERSALKYSFKEKNKISGYITSFIKSIVLGKVKYYTKGFGSHITEYYSLSEEFDDVSKMSNVHYDLLVAGSDQLWNPKITDGKLEPVFLLQFGQSNKRISLSTSLGSDKVREEDKKTFVQAFRSFDAISVREEFAKEQLQDLSNLPIKVTVDPTFLLDKHDWIKVKDKSNMTNFPKEKYILTYFVSSDKRSQRYYDIINNYARFLNLPVYAVQFGKIKKTPCKKIILGATISDFLNLIYNSELVITDSFHGVALSLNLNKNFIAIENKANPERVRYLLSKLNLADRIELPIEDNYDIEYCSVNCLIEAMRNDSINWIKDAIL